MCSEGVPFELPYFGLNDTTKRNAGNGIEPVTRRTSLPLLYQLSYTCTEARLIPPRRVDVDDEATPALAHRFVT